MFDPCIWKEEDGFYYSVSGTFQGGERGANAVGVDHLFRSEDLAEWEYLGPLMEDAFFAEPGEDAAVPNFWPIGNGKHMLLLFSHKRAGRYYIGEYDTETHRFRPETHGRMNYGPWVVGGLHAPSATIDDSGRYLGVFNMHTGQGLSRHRRDDDAAAPLLAGRRRLADDGAGGRGGVAQVGPPQRGAVLHRAE